VPPFLVNDQCTADDFQFFLVSNLLVGMYSASLFVKKKPSNLRKCSPSSTTFPERREGFVTGVGGRAATFLAAALLGNMTHLMGYLLNSIDRMGINVGKLGGSHEKLGY
jgi:hypothetical protein